MINKPTHMNSKNITLITFTIIFIACISIIFSSLSIDKSISNPYINNGILDLSDWDFEKDGVIELSGQWNGYKVNNEEFKGEGVEIYHLKIILNNKKENPLLRISDMSSFYNLYVNGDLIARDGIVGKNKYTTKEEGRTVVAKFDANESSLELVLQVDNFKHGKGEIGNSIYLGSDEAIQNIRYKQIFSEVFLFSTIFIMAFYHLVIYLSYRKNTSYLYFSMYCFTIAIRIIVTGSKSILVIFPNITWSYMMRIEYISFYLAVPLFTAFIYQFFKLQFSKKTLYMINIISIIFIILATISKEIVYTYTMIPFQIFTSSIGIYIIYVLTKACIKKTEGALILLIGVILVFITTMNDILYVNGTITTDYRFPIGVIMFVFFQAIVLGQNILKSLTRTEVLVRENRIMVDEILKLNLNLEKRNKELSNIAIYDSLTGVYNRSYFESTITRLDKEEELPTAIIIGDVNGLKLVNDAFGHLKGDMLLKKIVEILKDSCKDKDIIARIGGDEFVIILPSSDADRAEKVIESIRENCNRTDFDPIKPSISLGFSVRYSKEQLMTDIFKEADDYMYKRKLLESKSTRSSIIESLQKTLEETTFETREHAKRLEILSIQLGKELRLPENNLDDLLLLAMLHDIGKIAIPKEILTKSGKLSEREWNIIKRHPEIGYQIAISSPELRGIAQLILSHHERWDGTGYPQKLKEKEIPLLARIVAIVDSFDAMTQDRSYHEGITKDEALKEIKRCAGTQFDPYIVERFINMMKEKKEVANHK